MIETVITTITIILIVSNANKMAEWCATGGADASTAEA